MLSVLVTGGTGLVGSHTCRALVAAGHHVRLLVRQADKAQRFFQSLAEPVPELVVGDITRLASVKKAMAGCDAIVHAAATTPLQAESATELFAVNVQGVKNVVAAALDSGIKRIVCVSSVTAIFNTDGSKVNADSPPAQSVMPYGQSKAQAEIYLRQLQAQGAPIAIVYPGGILGPDDPGFSDTCKALKYRIDHGFRIFGNGGCQYIDVRDLAAFITALLQQGSSGRFVVPGVYSRWTEQADIIEAVAGCNLRRINASGWKMRLLGQAFDLARKYKPINSPVSAETMRYATQWPQIKNCEALHQHGIKLRDLSSSLTDTLAWMVARGHLSSSQCPGLANAPTGHHPL